VERDVELRRRLHGAKGRVSGGRPRDPPPVDEKSAPGPGGPRLPDGVDVGEPESGGERVDPRARRVEVGEVAARDVSREEALDERPDRRGLGSGERSRIVSWNLRRPRTGDEGGQGVDREAAGCAARDRNG
jgi:hypothetical protein